MSHPLPSRIATVLLSLCLGACGTLNRAGKDLAIGVASPVLMLWNGASDGVATAGMVRESAGAGWVVQAAVTPFTCVFHVIEHGCYGLVHVVDLPLCVVYGAASQLYPAGHEVEPLDIYQGTWFDRWAAEARRGHDIELAGGPPREDRAEADRPVADDD
ncbi:MAG: hypothetical protein H6835_06890 [Planctomycetes bacterium]|nr:hypothetical protein [Planctomycetota bacterium]